MPYMIFFLLFSILGLSSLYWYKRRLPRVKLVLHKVESIAKPKKGFVYVLSNKNTFKDGRIYKIGHTGQAVEKRIKSLHTSLPYDFKLEAAFETSNSKKLETILHSFLSNRRVRHNREFFWLNNPGEVTRVVEYIEQNYVI